MNVCVCTHLTFVHLYVLPIHCFKPCHINTSDSNPTPGSIVVPLPYLSSLFPHVSSVALIFLFLFVQHLKVLIPSFTGAESLRLWPFQCPPAVPGPTSPTKGKGELLVLFKFLRSFFKMQISGPIIGDSISYDRSGV